MLGGWATPLKGCRAAPAGESWLQSETFPGFLSRKIRSHGLPADHTEKGQLEQVTDRQHNYEIKYPLASSLQDDSEYEVIA